MWLSGRFPVDPDHHQLVGVNGASHSGLFDFLGPVGVVVCAIAFDGFGVNGANAVGVGEVAGHGWFVGGGSSRPRWTYGSVQRYA